MGWSDTHRFDYSTPVAELGLGLAALGRPLYINLGHGEDLVGATEPSKLEQRCHAVLDVALAEQVRYLDCARSYGRAEVFLGRWLRSRAVEPGQLEVASKWGYRYTADWDPSAKVHEVKDHSVEHLVSQFAKSNEHLWEYLDIYQIHSATLETGVLDDAGVQAKLAELKYAKGLSIGLSVSGERQAEVIRRALDVEVDGEPLFTVVQLTFNLLERGAEAAAKEAKAAGCAVVVKEGLANGRLSGRAQGQHRPGIGLASRVKTLEQEQGLSMDALALGALLQLPWIDVVLSGASTEQQLKSNLQSRLLSSDVALELWAGTEPEPVAAYWAHRKQLAWT